MQSFNLTTAKVHEFKNYLNQTNGDSYMKVVRDLIKFDPFNGHKFYIFSFMKLKDRERFHQPRLTKPDPVPGGTLIRVDPMHPEEMKLCWTLPSQEHFGLYKYKKAFGDQFVYECIQTYKKNPNQLIQPEPDDLKDDECRILYAELKKRIDGIKNREKAINGARAL